MSGPATSSLVGLVASVAVHAAAIGSVWFVAKPAPRARPRTELMEVVITEPAKVAPLPAQPAPRPIPVRRRAPRPIPSPVPPIAPEPAPPAPEPTPTIVADPPPLTVAPTSQVALPPAPPALDKVNLFDARALNAAPRVRELAPTHEGGLAILPGEGAGANAASEAERVAARIGGAAVDRNARSRVQAGLVDPAYTRLGRALLKVWDPDRALPDTSVELWAKNRARNAAVGMRLWMESAQSFARTGTPLAEGEEVELSEAANARDLGNPALAVDAQKVRETYRNFQRGKFNAARSALVLVEQHAERIQVSLVQSSGDRDVDQGALEDIRRAAEAIREELPVATRPRRSLWSLRLQIVITPPIPVGSFTFDEVLEAPKLELPLGRKLLKRIQLEAVYDDDPRLGGEPVPAASTPALPN